MNTISVNKNNAAILNQKIDREPKPAHTPSEIKNNSYPANQLMTLVMIIKNNTQSLYPHEQIERLKQDIYAQRYTIDNDQLSAQILEDLLTNNDTIS